MHTCFANPKQADNTKGSEGQVVTSPAFPCFVKLDEWELLFHCVCGLVALFQLVPSHLIIAPSLPTAPPIIRADHIHGPQIGVACHFSPAPVLGLAHSL